ncbi:Hypothetical predicted protein [Mytilus galloprovincialis]|uniref:TRIM2_3 n=1 Tax=Mytilus galloprovincialis TaxID=29158 RepID=A0A8B6FFU8_MYTGA|nr:Hypothetical predicted protein [Mytilus galloprovincialis]
MNQNDEIEKIVRQLESRNSLGEITVVKTETKLNRVSIMRREAQVQSREKSSISNMIMNIETKMDINIGYISDMICLMDGRVIIVQNEFNVNLLTSDGNLYILPITNEAFTATQINQDTIAITYPKDDVGEIRIIDLEGNTLKSILVRNKASLIYLIYCNDRVIYSGHNSTVRCVDESGNQIWQYGQDLSGPWRLCTDTYGNIIVIDQQSKQVIVISKDGQNSKVLINEEDGLEKLQCICFNYNEFSGFVCDFDGTYIAKFNLSSG